MSCTRSCGGDRRSYGGDRVFTRGRTHVCGARHAGGHNRPGGRAQIPARARGRRGGRAAVCGRLRGAAAAREDADLAPLPGGDRRPRHLLSTRSTATRSRCAASSSRSSRIRRASTPATLSRDPALHQAVLDQQRPLQQPDRAQVRAEDARRRRLPRRRRPPRSAARRSRRGQASRSTRCWRGCSRCSSIRTSIRSSPTRRPAPGKDILHGQRQQPLLRRRRWPTSRASTRSTASTRAS